MILIIGAGPAGLATAYYLKQRGLPFRILEREAAGATWRHHYDHLHLHSLKEVSALPGLPMPEDYPPFPSGEQVAKYLADYAAHFALPVERGVRVTGARYEEGWRLTTTRGHVEGDILVAATGIWSTPHRPCFPGEDLFAGRILHSKDYKRPQPLKGQRVLVVGVGNSGSEVAVGLAREGVDVNIAVRSGVRMVPYPSSERVTRTVSWLLRHLPHGVANTLLGLVQRDFSEVGLPLPDGPIKDVYPVVGFGLASEVKAGRIGVKPGLSSFFEKGVQFEDGTSEFYDAVILATGYRPSLQFLDGVHTDEAGLPRLEPPHNVRSTQNSTLFCVGYHYPTNEAWFQALPRVARNAADEVARTHAQSIAAKTLGKNAVSA